MSDEERAFPTRLLRMGTREAVGAEAAAVDPERINQHILGLPDQPRVMTDEEAAELLNDPFGVLVLRAGIFPSNLDELLAAFDTHNNSGESGVPGQKSYLISEGGQIRFAAGADKGGSRLLIVRFSASNTPEVMLSTLLPAGVSPRRDNILLEVLGWDPVNQTLHFYQRQNGAWFWCGQSDMALDDATRGHGPFDSHVNGYPLMKELKSPWVHWHGPGLGISETSYAPDDPLVTDPLFMGKDHALNFEREVMRPLADRWNAARFAKAQAASEVMTLPWLRQVLDSSSVNLISTHKEWSQIDSSGDLDDLPPTFFFDQDCLQSVEIGLQVNVPPLVLSRERYQALVSQHDLRVRGEGIDQPGDVPFCFTVPERALEDVLVTRELIRSGAMSARLAACLLMVDVANPIFSASRASLLEHLPSAIGFGAGGTLDDTFVPNLEAAASTGHAAATEFVANWQLGPDAWRGTFVQRLESFLAAVIARLATDEGADDVFRLAESRRREFRQRPLAEFGLSLPQAVAIPEDAPALRMALDGTVVPKP